MLTFVIPAHKMPPSEVAFVRRMLLQGGMDSQVRLVHDAYVGLLYTCFCRSTRSLVPRPEKETVFNSRQLYSLYPQQAAQSDVLGYITHTPVLTALCPGLPRWAGTRKVKPISILLGEETV